MHILMTGGTGFIGQALSARLRQQGHTLIILSRQQHPADTGIRYIRSLDELGGHTALDAVINLAGASLAGQRWSESYKGEIVSSRLDVTAQVFNLIDRLERPPGVLLSASAVGFYGHHEDQALVETSAVQPGFSQSLCAQWERSALQAETLGVRVCLLRLGVVLGPGGGALTEMARSFKLGVATWLGSGHQWLSWIHLEDVVAATEFLLARQDLSGPYNVTAPSPVTSREFSLALKKHYVTLLEVGVPAAVARVLIGEMADELLLQGQKVLPQALAEAGFEFRFGTLGSALDDIYADQSRLRSFRPSG